MTEHVNAPRDRWARDYLGRRVRLTTERLAHVLEHPEMRGQERKLRSTLRAPDRVLENGSDPSVHLYFRWYRRTPVGSKLLLVAVKISERDRL